MTKQRITAIAALVFFCAAGAFGAFIDGGNSIGWQISLVVLVAAMSVWAVASGWEPDEKPTAQSWNHLELVGSERIVTYHTYYGPDGITLARVWTLNTGQAIVELNQRRVATVQMRFTAGQTAEIARNLTAAGHTGVTEPMDP